MRESFPLPPRNPQETQALQEEIERSEHDTRGLTLLYERVNHDALEGMDSQAFVQSAGEAITKHTEAGTGLEEAVEFARSEMELGAQPPPSPGLY